MEKTSKKYKSEGFMQGVLALMFSQVLIKVLGLVYKMYLTNRPGFGDEGNAIYSAGYYIYALLLTISSVGVPNAISKLISERIAVEDYRGSKRIFQAAFCTFAVVGLIGSLILFLGAHYIANVMVQIPEAEMTLVALSPSIFFVAIASVIRGYFNGTQKMSATAKSQTLEQVFKSVLTIIIVEIVATFSSTNTALMAAGANLATTLSVILSFVYLIAYLRKQKKYREKMKIQPQVQKIKYRKESIKTIVKRILYVSVPMSLSAILSSINKNIDSMTVVRGLKNFLTEADAKVQYGILSGKVDTLTTLPLSFNIAFATALVPVIAAARAKNDMSSANKRVSFSILVTILIGLPCTVGMYIFAEQILALLFPAQSSGVLVLQISSLAIIFSVLIQTINGALQGIGKVMVPAVALGIGVVVKLILNLVLVPNPAIGVNGAAIGNVVCNVIACIIGFVVLKRNIDIEMKFSKFVLKPIMATVIMGICSMGVYTVLIGMHLAMKKATIIAIIVAVITYALALVVLKIFTKEEICMIPYGQKICKVLEKTGIYK